MPPTSPWKPPPPRGPPPPTSSDGPIIAAAHPQPEATVHHHGGVQVLESSSARTMETVRRSDTENSGFPLKAAEVSYSQRLLYIMQQEELQRHRTPRDGEQGQARRGGGDVQQESVLGESAVRHGQNAGPVAGRPPNAMSQVKRLPGVPPPSMSVEEVMERQQRVAEELERTRRKFEKVTAQKQKLRDLIAALQSNPEKIQKILKMYLSQAANERPGNHPGRKRKKAAAIETFIQRFMQAAELTAANSGSLKAAKMQGFVGGHMPDDDAPLLEPSLATEPFPPTGLDGLHDHVIPSRSGHDALLGGAQLGVGPSNQRGRSRSRSRGRRMHGSPQMQVIKGEGREMDPHAEDGGPRRYTQDHARARARSRSAGRRRERHVVNNDDTQMLTEQRGRSLHRRASTSQGHGSGRERSLSRGKSPSNGSASQPGTRPAPVRCFEAPTHAAASRQKLTQMRYPAASPASTTNAYKATRNFRSRSADAVRSARRSRQTQQRATNGAGTAAQAGGGRRTGTLTAAAAGYANLQEQAWMETDGMGDEHASLESGQMRGRGRSPRPRELGSSSRHRTPSPSASSVLSTGSLGSRQAERRITRGRSPVSLRPQSGSQAALRRQHAATMGRSGTGSARIPSKHSYSSPQLAGLQRRGRSPAVNPRAQGPSSAAQVTVGPGYYVSTSNQDSQAPFTTNGDMAAAHTDMVGDSNLPDDWADDDSAPSSQSSLQLSLDGAIPSREEQQDGHPDDWKQLTDPASGRVYYYSASRKKSQWKL